jgi:hypothetical protein
MTSTIPPPAPPPPKQTSARPAANKAADLASARKPAAIQPEAPPEEPKVDPAEFAIWLHQLSLILCACSGVVALVVARFADRPWLAAVFSAFVAACITGLAGTAVAKALLVVNTRN